MTARPNHLPAHLLARLSGTPRLLLAAALLVAGAVGVVATGAPPPTAAVTVAVHAVGAGEVVAPDAVRTEHRPRSEVPDGTLAAAQVVGRRVVAAVSRGEVLTAARVAGPAWRVEPGTAVVAVQVAPATAGVVPPGDLVDVVVGGSDDPGSAWGTGGASGAGNTPGAGSAPGGAGAEGTADPTVLARGARVLAVWPGAEGSDHATVVLQVEFQVAPRIVVLPPQTLVGLVAGGP